MEEELVNSAKAGDNEAFYSLISLYKSKLYNTAYCYLKNEVDSLEAIQEVTCRAYIKLNKVKEPKYFGTWIMRILINYCIDEQKRKKKFIYQEKDHSIENNEFNLDNTLIEAAINKLKPKYKNAIILKYFQDMSIQEISGILNCPTATVKTWIHRGLDQMRSNLNTGGDINV